MLKNGEHVAAIWLQDDGTYSWYLGVICDVYGDHANVSYLKQTDKVGVHWVFPEEVEVQQTSFEQIMASGFEVKYTQSGVRIRCSIEKAFAEELSN
uniref:Tudor domain-containing protein n=2 Tax=Clytia hemisphaerica TaxID=252671 RepID=A0A7M5WQV2_9CNID